MTTTHKTPIPPEILDQMPASDPAAEIGVIGSILLDPNLCDDVALEVTAGEFYTDANRILFSHMIDMHNSGDRIDTMLLGRRLKDSADWKAIGGLAYLTTVLESVPVAAHAVYYAKIVREKAVLRSLNSAGMEIIRDVADTTVGVAELLSRCEERIFAVADQRGGRRARRLHDVLLDAMDAIDLRMENGPPGLPTGFHALDRLIGGFHDCELIILGGRPGMGKTSLALNILDYVGCECALPALLISLEMSELELVQRMLCGRAEVDGYKFRSGYLGPEDRKRLVKATAKQSQAPLWIDDSPTATMTEIAATARRLKRKENLGLIMIDYLQLITPDDPRRPRQEQVATMARRLKALARELAVPVLCLAQLNREVEKSSDNRPRLSNLRESGAVEQDADVVMFIHREEYYRTKENAKDVRGQAELLIRKQRNGPTGDVKLTWRAEFTQFEDRATEPELNRF